MEEADNKLCVAEAQLAQAPGYPLCRCTFPPTLMLAVGAGWDIRQQARIDIHECPVCGRDDNGTGGTWVRYSDMTPMNRPQS